MTRSFFHVPLQNVISNQVIQLENVTSHTRKSRQGKTYRNYIPSEDWEEDEQKFKLDARSNKV